MTEKTIAAIATPSAPGGIGIVRISGPGATQTAAKVFRPVNHSDLTKSKGYRAYFGYVFAGEERIDEAVCLVFRAPKSYTGEDVCEISCHGGLYITKRILRACLDAGAVPAGPGEFTKRAFLNGKIDLAQSESVMALISATGEMAAAAAVNTLEGRLSGEIRQCREKIVAVCASLAAWVDYPDDEIEEISCENILQTFREVRGTLAEIIRRFDCGRAVTEGIDTVIVGKPNVGKSTLMNFLSGFERSIVTDIAGTTRDVVEEKIVLSDIVLKIADTAGIHETENRVESLGVSLAKKRLDRAELVICLFDGSREIGEEDYDLISLCKGKKTVAVISKTDLPNKIDKSVIEKHFDNVTEISCLENRGREEIEEEIKKIFFVNSFDPSLSCLTGERQRQCCLEACDRLQEAIEALESGVTLDAVNVLADLAVDALLSLTGEKATEEVVNEVFSRFCVGK